MEPTTVNQEGANLQLMGISGCGMGLFAMTMTCTAIAGRWGTFGWKNKSLAILFVLILVLVPLGIVFKEKTWAKRLEAIGKANLLLGYSWVLLAAMLFGDV